MVKMRAWCTALERKGLKVNSAKSKVTVSALDAGEAEQSGKFPCRVCHRGVGANSIQCTACTKWVHRRCSGITGSGRWQKQCLYARDARVRYQKEALSVMGNI